GGPHGDRLGERVCDRRRAVRDCRHREARGRGRHRSGPVATRPTAVALTVAGSDSGGGAGIQADLKTFAALGVYGVSAITAVTAQNTRGVSAVETLSPGIVSAQIAAVVEDFQIAALKTGMLANSAIIGAVARVLRVSRVGPLVVDPVIVSKSGD